MSNASVNTESYSVSDILTDRVFGHAIWELGPNDLCILTMSMNQKGLKKLFNKPKKISKFYHIYGVNTSSLASIALYFKQVSDSFLNSSKFRLISGCFCVYDIFSQCDIRVEIEIPGTAHAYLITSNNEKKQVKESDWQRCYLSSSLRFFNPIDPKATFIDHFNTFELLENVFDLILRHKRKFDIISIDSTDKEQYFISLIFDSFNKYLISRKLYKTHQGIYMKYIEKDPMLINSLCQSSFKIDEVDQVISLVMHQIKVNPHAFLYYYSAARAYYKKGEFTEALQLCQYLIELNSEEFEYWELLIKCYIKSKNFKAALICFNFIPISCKDPNKLIPKFHEKKGKLENFNRNFYIINKNPDFFVSQSQASTFTEKEKKELEKLQTLSSDKYHSQTKRAYNLLIDLERNINLANISSLRDSVLKLSNPINDFHNKENSSLASTDESSQNLSQDSILKAKKKLSLLFEPSLYFQQNIFTELFNSLKMDLNCFLNIRKIFLAIDKFTDSPRNNTPGILWIFRGKVAERLKKYSVALNCYKLAVDKGFSLFAWYKVIKLSYRVGNPYFVVSAVNSLLDLALQMNVCFDVLPQWLEKILGKLCAECGFRQVNSLIQEICSHHKCLSSTLKKLHSLENYKN